MSQKPSIKPYKLGLCVGCDEFEVLHKVLIGNTMSIRCHECCEQLIKEDEDRKKA